MIRGTAVVLAALLLAGCCEHEEELIELRARIWEQEMKQKYTDEHLRILGTLGGHQAAVPPVSLGVRQS
jgi:uncharacterized protein YcfL